MVIVEEHGDGEILRVQDWLEEHFDQPLPIDDTARRFGFGVRNFKRRFKKATGYTPQAYLQTLRLEKAKALLESTRMTLDSITYKVGYEDSNSFRRLFQQRVGLLPAAYRKKFQAAGGLPDARCRPAQKNGQGSGLACPLPCPDCSPPRAAACPSHRPWPGTGPPGRSAAGC